MTVYTKETTRVGISRTINRLGDVEFHMYTCSHVQTDRKDFLYVRWLLSKIAVCLCVNSLSETHSTKVPLEKSRPNTRLSSLAQADRLGTKKLLLTAAIQRCSPPWKSPLASCSTVTIFPMPPSRFLSCTLTTKSNKNMTKPNLARTSPNQAHVKHCCPPI